MSHPEMIELTLSVETMDERLSRLMVGFSAEDGVTADLHVDRYEVHCHHEHEVEQ